VYAKCITGQQEDAKRRIEAASREDVSRGTAVSSGFILGPRRLLDRAVCATATCVNLRRRSLNSGNSAPYLIVYPMREGVRSREHESVLEALPAASL
jgi:hypothetical protein